MHKRNECAWCEQPITRRDGCTPPPWKCVLIEGYKKILYIYLISLSLSLWITCRISLWLIGVLGYFSKTYNNNKTALSKMYITIIQQYSNEIYIKYYVISLLIPLEPSDESLVQDVMLRKNQDHKHFINTVGGLDCIRFKLRYYDMMLIHSLGKMHTKNVSNGSLLSCDFHLRML